jgi:hypothetical protein
LAEKLNIRILPGKTVSAKDDSKNKEISEKI